MLPILQITKSFYWRVGHLATGGRCQTYLTLWTLMEMACSVWRSTTFWSCAPVERNVIRMPGWFAKVIISLWHALDVCRCVTRCVWNDLQELICFCFLLREQKTLIWGRISWRDRASWSWTWWRPQRRTETLLTCGPAWKLWATTECWN